MKRKTMKYLIGSSLMIFSLQGLCETENKQPSIVCMQLIQITASAFDFKSKGKTKEEMLAPLPTKEALAKYPEAMYAQRLLGEQMIEVISDIYNNGSVPKIAYSAYRSESCYRSSTNKPVVKNFSSILPKLLECGNLDQQEQYNCGFALAKP